MNMKAEALVEWIQEGTKGMMFGIQDQDQMHAHHNTEICSDVQLKHFLKNKLQWSGAVQ